VIISENSPRFDFQNFAIDTKNGMLFLVLEFMSKTQTSTNQFFLKIFDLKENDKIILETMIENPTLQGILCSGAFTLVDGHIYYNNNVIKVRYDLIKDKLARNLTNDEIFNQYDDILDLQNN
jgi:hypothetical protein